MESPDGTRKQANANKQNDKKSLGSESLMSSEADDQNENVLDQNDVYSLAKE